MCNVDKPDRASGISLTIQSVTFDTCSNLLAKSSDWSMDRPMAVSAVSLFVTVHNRQHEK